ncbi:hypothetical protein C8Q72DRAFT_864637 [Fomitopsis betulina]|nr:hypothetical protein C8Q72DRAFT_864637 [Fomitopsis betulina]
MPWLPDLIPRLVHLRALELGNALAENVSGLLAQAQTSCRSLSRVYVQLFVHRSMHISKDLGPAVYPLVDALRIYGELHSLESLADKFPNIQALNLLPYSNFVARQHTHSVPEDQWTRLDWVATATALPRMRIVRHLRLHYWIINAVDGNTNGWRPVVDRTASMFRATRPVVVDCFMNDLMLRLLGEHATNLKFIRLRTITPSGKAVNADFETMINWIIARLSSLPLRGLMLSLIADVPFPHDWGRKFAGRLCVHLKQLEYIGLASASCGWTWRRDWCTWFRVTRRPGHDPVVKILTQEEGRNVHDQLLASQHS